MAKSNVKIETSNLIINDNPKSSFSEALKGIRTNLQFAAIDKDTKVILVTSPNPGDGKSLIASNLAGAYAQENKKVLIIDCDLRKGRQADIFGIKKTQTTGYTNLILNYTNASLGIIQTDKIELKDYICKTGVKNVHLIPNGPIPPNPIELLGATKNKELIEALKKIYDIVILDCPPVLGLSDTLVMTRYSDINIVVVSCGKTKVDDLGDVKKAFDKAKANITGIILNKTKKTTNNYYYGYYGE